MAGDLETARAGYLAELTADAAAGPAAWAGLAVTLDRSQVAAGEALRDRPELVREVYQRIWCSTGAPADPVEVAAWIGGDPSA